jgi:dynein heavy chain
MRFLRHFFVLYTEPFDQSSLTTIFSSILDWYFKNLNPKLPNNIMNLKDNIIESTIEVYGKIKTSKELFPIPSKSHYSYNMRDISKIFQGMTNANFKSFQNEDDFIKLWAHECQRVFMDRLISTDDQNFFTDNILKRVIANNFKKKWSEIVKFEPLLWGSFIPTMYPEGDTTKKPMSNVYCELVNRKNLQKYSDEFLETYNEMVSTKLNLVLF